MKNKISIIIPAYFEENVTLNTVKNLLSITKDIELIIVYKWEKYGYIKEKLDILWWNIKLIEFNWVSTRAILMNLWAEKSTWDIILFLHNDTILPKNYYDLLSDIDLSKYNYGWFYKQFCPNNFILRINSFITNMRLNFFWSLLWDNSIFVSKYLFFEIWWFPNTSLMEDVEMSKKLKDCWKIFIIKEKTITSSTKFLKNWSLETLIFMWYLRFLYFIWTNTDLLKEKYSRF